jgi:hypothetical protein
MASRAASRQTAQSSSPSLLGAGWLLLALLVRWPCERVRLRARRMKLSEKTGGQPAGHGEDGSPAASGVRLRGVGQSAPRAAGNEEEAVCPRSSMRLLLRMLLRMLLEVAAAAAARGTAPDEWATGAEPAGMPGCSGARTPSDEWRRRSTVLARLRERPAAN